MRRSSLLLTLLFILVSACNPPASNPDLEPAPVVLTSTTFLADMARNVAGNRVRVESLLPIGMDPHSYQPTPADVARMSKSAVLIVNGLGYEQFLSTLLENAGGGKKVIEAAAGLGQSKDAGDGIIDPHVWLDPNLVIKYVENIRDGLIEADPAGAEVYRVNAESYISQLKDLDAWTVRQVSQIPAERRLLVTNHEALAYFADRYGFKIVGAVIPSVSTDAAPSARQMANLIDQIKSTGVPAIFLSEVDNPALANQIAAETGVKVVGDLHLESLTDGPPAATYIDMMKYDVTRIVEALK